MTLRAVGAAGLALGLFAASAVALVLALSLALEPPQLARAADPGRWTETGRSTIPLYYYQGMTSDPAKRLFFNGVHVGLYRTDQHLHEEARRDDVIPSDVHAREGYNHIGDIDWDAREGGRILLPLECYYPRAAPDNTEDPNNTCRTGAIGVADPETLAWRYYVKLDPAEIPKAMWAEVSPDGELLWTGSRRDLLAYDMDDIREANAHPAAPPIKAVKRLAGARPPSGITGAAFFRGRFYVAGQDNPAGFQIWSIDLETGAGQLEIEREVVGESEGIEFFEGLGGQLHWMIQPYNQESVPTYGVSNGTILHFTPKDEPAGASGPAQRPAKIRLTASPRHIRSGRVTRVRFRARATIAGRDEPVNGAK
ncbi:MAG: hypothetical protein M3340_05250, partial [Actinomycetota bacterium]|nr:hypothetical protein [Actinomycetota bacterium]